MLEIRYGSGDDLVWLAQADQHVSAIWVERCIAQREYIVALLEGERAGFLRYSWFWGSIPYMDMILIDESRQRRGIGTRLFEFWETEMRAHGARTLMTSSESSETAPQAWHRRNGFEPCGQLTFGQWQSDAELFFVKDLT